MAIALVVLAVGVPLLRMFAEWLGRPIDEATAWLIVQANARSATIPAGAVFGGLWDRIVSWAFGCAVAWAFSCCAGFAPVFTARLAVDPDPKDLELPWPIRAVGAAIVSLIVGLPLGALVGAIMGALIGGVFGTIWVAVFGGSGVPAFSHWLVVWIAQFAALVTAIAADKERKLTFRGAWLLQPACVVTTLATMAYLFQGRAPNLVLAGHQGPVTSVAFSPDGQFVASGSADKTVRLWRVSDGQVVTIFKEHGDRVNGVAFSPDGRLLASGSSDKKVRLWSVTGGQIDRTLDGPGEVQRIAFSPDGKLLAAGCYNGAVRLWRLDDGRPPLTLQSGSRSDCTGLAFTSDGSSIAAAFLDHDDVQLWQSADGQPKSTIPSKHGIASIACSPGGALLAAGSEKGLVEFRWNRDFEWYEGDIQVLDASSGKLLDSVAAHSGDVTSLAFTPDGKILASAGGADRTVRLWHVGAAVTPVAVLEGHGGDVTSVAVSPDGPLIAAGGADKTIRLWRGPSALLWK